MTKEDRRAFAQGLPTREDVLPRVAGSDLPAQQAQPFTMQSMPVGEGGGSVSIVRVEGAERPIAIRASDEPLEEGLYQHAPVDVARSFASQPEASRTHIGYFDLVGQPAAAQAGEGPGREEVYMAYSGPEQKVTVFPQHAPVGERDLDAVIPHENEHGKAPWTDPNHPRTEADNLEAARWSEAMERDGLYPSSSARDGGPAADRPETGVLYDRTLGTPEFSKYQELHGHRFAELARGTEGGERAATASAQGETATESIPYLRTPEEPSGVGVLRDAYDSLTDEQRLADFYIDSNSGVLNDRAFTRLPAVGEVAHISVEGVKYVNDTHGHQVGNQLYQAAAAALHEAAPDVAKVGGDFALRVRDQAELDEVLARARPFMPEGFALTGALGATHEEAGRAHGDLKARLEAEGARAPRGARPLGLTGQPDFPEVRAQAEVPVGLRSAFDEMSRDETFKEVHQEAQSGLLKNGAFRALPPKRYKAFVDLNGLSSVNSQLGRPFGDLVVDTFERVAAENGGQGFDMAHRHGDEYLAQGDDRAALEAFLEGLAGLAESVEIRAENPATGEVKEYRGISFGRGVGETVEEADAALNAHKAQLAAEGKRGPEADARRIHKS
jgi:GGDEF domain-containing protein